MYKVTFKQKTTGAQSIIHCGMVMADYADDVLYWKCSDRDGGTISLFRFTDFSMIGLAWEK